MVFNCHLCYIIRLGPKCVMRFRPYLQVMHQTLGDLNSLFRIWNYTNLLSWSLLPKREKKIWEKRNRNVLHEAYAFRRLTITSLLNMIFLSSTSFTLRAPRFAWKDWGFCEECQDGGGQVFYSILNTLTYDMSASQYLCSHWRNRWWNTDVGYKDVTDSSKMCHLNHVLI